MPTYDWNANISPSLTHFSNLPEGINQLPSSNQTSDSNGRILLDGFESQRYTEHLSEFTAPGFRYLDQAMKYYFSGIRVPTKDSYRLMGVKIAGGDKSLMCWADDLKEGRVILPVAAIDRQGAIFNKDKFSPPHHAMSFRYLNSSGSLAAKIYRPVPYLVDYSIIIWAEHKRDAEHIIFQIMPRFNPIAEFRAFDGQLAGNVQLLCEGYTDTSEKEAGYDQKANIRYELSVKAEAWLALPEKVTDVVLGSVFQM